MSAEFITLFMFASMLLLMATGQRVFGVIGFVGAVSALWLWGAGSAELPFNASIQVLNWFPLITVPFFVFMGYMLSESGLAGNLYRMFHVWFGGLRGGLALGTIGLMVLISSRLPAWRSAPRSRCRSSCGGAMTSAWSRA
jgi:TRAP-type mannitol/chloroaromatic compound transport system permease large subunit